MTPRPIVHSVSASAIHSFSKPLVDFIEIEVGVGVRGDAHSGSAVKHRSRVAASDAAFVETGEHHPNLRQVHLVHAELFDELKSKGFDVGPGDIGENISTRGIDLLALPPKTILRIGAHAEIEITGLRNPCKQLDEFQPGLLAAVLDKTPDGELIRKAGIMAIATKSGRVEPGDEIVIELPDEHHRSKRLERV